MTVVRLSGRLLCGDDDERRRVIDHLPAHVRATRAEPGCIHFDVTPTDDPYIWDVSESFVDQAAFNGHQERMRASAWAAATAGIERRYTVEHGPATTEETFAVERSTPSPGPQSDADRTLD